MQLVIGNKNYSSWSLRPWALLKYFEIEFSEKMVWLFSNEMEAELTALSPNMKVPVLIDEDVTVWDSLAICEYINEQCLNGKALPSDTKLRAEMRAICAEMHSGFFALRDEMPLNCRRPPASITLSDSAHKDITRVIALLKRALETQLLKRECYGKDSSGKDSSVKKNHPLFLFGEFSIADAFYLPVMSRFSVYNIDLPEIVLDYQKTMLQLPCYQDWLAGAVSEKAVIKHAEI